MAGVKSPQVGKLGGTGGKSASVPTWSTRFIPITVWNKKWQWNIQKPVNNHERCIKYNHQC